MRSAALTLCLITQTALAHDVGVDLLSNFTRSSSNNPRAGSLGLSLSGSFDFSQKWTGFLLATYVRDFATKTAESESPGSNIFLFSGGAMFIPTDHLMFMASVTGAPPTQQRNATVQEYATGTADVVIRSTNASLGGTLLTSWTTNGFSKWEHTVDVAVGLNHFDSDQQVELGSTVRARLYRVYCERNPTQGYCPLVNGVSTNLTQVRLAATYTATLFTRTDVGVELAGFVYDIPDPLGIGLYSSVVAGRQGPDLGQGIPVAPWLITVRPSVLHRFSRKVSVRVGYQLGVYVADTGTNHLLSVRASWKLTPSFRLTASLLGQADLLQGAFVNGGGSALVGVLFLFP